MNLKVISLTIIFYNELLEEFEDKTYKEGTKMKTEKMKRKERKKKEGRRKRKVNKRKEVKKRKKKVQIVGDRETEILQLLKGNFFSFQPYSIDSVSTKLS